MERAVAAAKSADSRERTEHEYEHRVRGKSSAAPTASLWKGWMRLLVVSILFLPWEIEGFLMLAEKVCIDEVQNAVTIKLSSSKTDPRTLTTTGLGERGCA